MSRQTQLNETVAVFHGGPLDGVASTHFCGEAWFEGEFDIECGDWHGTYHRSQLDPLAWHYTPTGE